jgi:uncharacterized protein
VRKPLPRNPALSRRIRRILVIDEGSPGHLAQSRGLARALAEHCQAELEEYPVRLVLRGIFRPWLRIACSMARRGLPECLLRLAYRLPEGAPMPAADLLITSGGRGLYFAASLARRLRCPLVFCGDPAPLPAAWCDAIVSPLPLAGHPLVIRSELLLTEITPQSIVGCGEDLREKFRQSGGETLAALLIGGDSRSHRYTAADWQDLIDTVNQRGAQGWRWLISTSRRTPVDVAERLRQGIKATYLVHAVWWHERPERVLQGYLDAADIVLVSRDSLTMLSEAIAAGKPTVALAPRRTLPSPFIDPVLAGQVRGRRLREVALADLPAMPFAMQDFSPLNDSRLPDYARQLAALLCLLPRQTEVPLTFGVIVPTYNRPGYLSEAIQSVLAQSYPHWKLLICNDASVVDYSPVAPWLEDKRIVMIQAPCNGGPNRARNMAIDLAAAEGCDYIIFMDDEDRLDPQALAIGLQMIAAHPDTDWFISNTTGDRKAGQRDIASEGHVDWIADYAYGKKLRGDKTHIVSLAALGDIRFDGRLRVETWHFFLPLAARARIWAYPYPSRRIRYLDDGITRTNSRHPGSWREIKSRFARHRLAIRLCPWRLAAWRYALLELLKTPLRMVRLLLGRPASPRRVADGGPPMQRKSEILP